MLWLSLLLPVILAVHHYLNSRLWSFWWHCSLNKGLVPGELCSHLTKMSLPFSFYLASKSLIFKYESWSQAHLKIKSQLYSLAMWSWVSHFTFFNYELGITVPTLQGNSNNDQCNNDQVIWLCLLHSRYSTNGSFKKTMFCPSWAFSWNLFSFGKWTSSVGNMYFSNTCMENRAILSKTCSMIAQTATCLSHFHSFFLSNRTWA